MNGKLPAGRYLPLDTPVHRLDGRVKLLGLFILIAAIVAARSPLDYAILAVFIAALVAASRIGARVAAGGMRQVGPLLLVILLMNACFYSGEQVVWSWWIIHISLAGLVQGINIALKVVLLMVVSGVLLAAASPLELTSGVERLLGPLRRLGLPVGELALMISVALQFLPILMEENSLIVKAQTARGAKLDSRRLRDKAAAALPLVIPMFISAFRRADELALAMEARGYRGGGLRPAKKNLPLRAADWAGLLLCAVVLATQLIC